MRGYLWTFAGLIALTTLTLVLSFFDLHAFSIILALLIGAAKSVLIALFFMHMIEHRTSTRVAFMVSIVLAATLIVLVTLDPATRVPVTPESPASMQR